MFDFAVDEASDLPLWVQIKNRLVFLIGSEYYKPGTQLPSVRSLAAELRVSYNTVSKAYMALAREGYVETRHGSGAYVRDVDIVSEDSGVETMVQDFVKSCLAAGMTYDDIPTIVNSCVFKMKREGNAGFE